MKKLNVFILTNLSIITLNCCYGQQITKSKDKEINTKKVVGNSILVSKSQYKIIYNENGILDIEIIDNDLLEVIRKSNEPIIRIMLVNKYFIAKGNSVFSSFTPKNCDYFYPLDKKKVVINNGKINFRKIDKSAD